MKNKILMLLWFASLLPAVASAQDTTRYLDQWYLFRQYHDYTTLVAVNGQDSNVVGIPANNHLFKYYSSVGGTMVYGIALTIHALPPTSNEWTPSFYLYRTISKEEPLIFTIADSVNLDGPRVNRYFEYRYGNQESESLIVPCLEFYFDTPQFFSGQDSFYLSHYWSNERFSLYQEYHQGNPGDTITHITNWLFLYYGLTAGATEEHSFSYDRDTLNVIYPNIWTYGRPKQIWGGMFPIIGLRCTAPRVSLVERVGGSATVNWTAAEAGQEYQLAYAPFGTEPDSATQVSTTDTVFILDSLEAGARTSVWVRKACRYTTAGYDTVVWSDWSTALTFMALGVGEVDDGSVTVTARGLDVVVAGAREEVRVYDMAGRCVAVARPHAASVTLPVPAPGVYMVRTGAGTARKVVVLR